MSDDFDARLLREKLASLKEFAYGASHELNNPLFNISSRAQSLLRDERDPQRRQKLATIYSHAMRASQMIQEMALAAHPPRPALALVDAGSVLREVKTELTPVAQQHGIELSCAGSESDLTLVADATQIAVLVRELCLNAINALGRSAKTGTVKISAAVDAHADGIVITVTDDGPGLDERARRHLFDPFFSGYESGRGLGFGLTKCWQIVDVHGGQIVVHSQPGRGTSFVVHLPRQPAASSAS
jgi:signal transduction histidine kinase